LTVPVWIDRKGNRTTPPLTDGDVTGEAVGMGILTLGGSLIAFGASRGVWALLDRSEGSPVGG